MESLVTSTLEGSDKIIHQSKAIHEIDIVSTPSKYVVDVQLKLHVGSKKLKWGLSLSYLWDSLHNLAAFLGQSGRV